MKIAILITGDYRTFDHCVNSWAPLLNGNDIYVSTWNETFTEHWVDKTRSYIQKNITQEHITSILKGYSVKQCVIDDTSFNKTSKDYYNWAICYRWKRGFQLIKQSGIQYNLVVVVRPDLIFPDNFYIDWNTFDSSFLYTGWPFENHKEKINDIITIGSMDNIEKMLVSPEEYIAFGLGDWHKNLASYCNSKQLQFKKLEKCFLLARPPVSNSMTYLKYQENLDTWTELTIKGQKAIIGHRYLTTIWDKWYIDKLYQKKKKAIFVYNLNEDLSKYYDYDKYLLIEDTVDRTELLLFNLKNDIFDFYLFSKDDVNIESYNKINDKFIFTKIGLDYFGEGYEEIIMKKGAD